MTNNNNTTLAKCRPSLLGRHVFDDVFDNFFNSSPNLLKQVTQGYPVSDIYRNEDGSTTMDFALAGFSKEDLSIEVKPEKRSITVRADSSLDEAAASNRRIARRSFEKTYVNYDDNLDLSTVSAEFENGLLRITIFSRPETKPVSVKIK
jgi:HSP20 family molecular chaperone IbpA|tara:strand:+ start:165 stop:611 length:447 start_codon:yes stop_codon:yes gene_type:complete